MFDHFPGLDWPTPYGTMLALACVVSWWCARRRAPVCGIEVSHIDLVWPLALVTGSLVAWWLDAAIPTERQLAGDALQIQGRLRLPLLMMVMLPVLLVYCLVTGISFRRIADVLAPGALLSIAVLRIGCFLAGCCFGDIVGHTSALGALADPRLKLQVQTLPSLSPESLPWAVRYPAHGLAFEQHVVLGLVAADATQSLPVHPVQLYESAAALLLAWALLRVRTLDHRPGLLALSALIAYAVLAFGLQFLRADSASMIGLLNLTQLLYLAWLGAGLTAVALIAWRHSVRLPAPARRLSAP